MLHDLSEPRTIRLNQADAKRALAIYAHLQQLERTAVRDNRFLCPLDMDQAELVLASASLRALFFDDRPLLLSFLKDHDLHLEVDALETNLNLLLMSQLAVDGRHASDFFAHVLLDPEMRERHPVDDTFEGLHWWTEPGPFAEAMQQPDTWVPTRDEDASIGTGVSHLTGDGGPAQLLTITRRRTRLGEWGLVRIGYLKTLAINRRNLFSYVANKLGGVHYDAKRLPSNAADKAQFKGLAGAYDWNNQALTHAGFVGVGLGCLEIVASPEIHRLLEQLRSFHTARQGRLSGAGAP